MGSFTLRQLEFAVAVDDAGAICAAAKEIQISQPSLSQQIRQLELTLGVDLFDRTPTGTEVTEAGRVFLSHARTVLEEVRRAQESITQQADRSVRVGVENLVDVRRVLSSAGEAFGSRAGDSVKVSQFRDPEGLRNALNTREIDLAVGSHQPEWQDSQVSLGNVTLQLMTSTTRGNSPLRDARWMHAAGAETFTMTAICAAGLEHSHRSSEAESYEYVSAMVEQGLGVALLPTRFRTTGIRPVRELPAIHVPISAYALRLTTRSKQLWLELQREFDRSTVSAH